MSDFAQKIEIYQAKEKHWLNAMNMVHAPLLITLQTTGNDHNRAIEFVTTITGKRTETLKKIISYQEFENAENAISQIFKDLEDDVRLFLARFACDNF